MQPCKAAGTSPVVNWENQICGSPGKLLQKLWSQTCVPVPVSVLNCAASLLHISHSSSVIRYDKGA